MDGKISGCGASSASSSICGAGATNSPGRKSSDDEIDIGIVSGSG